MLITLTYFIEGIPELDYGNSPVGINLNLLLLYKYLYFELKEEIGCSHKKSKKRLLSKTRPSL